MFLDPKTFDSFFNAFVMEQLRLKIKEASKFWLHCAKQIAPGIVYRIEKNKDLSFAYEPIWWARFCVEVG